MASPTLKRTSCVIVAGAVALLFAMLIMSNSSSTLGPLPVATGADGSALTSSRHAGDNEDTVTLTTSPPEDVGASHVAEDQNQQPVADMTITDSAGVAAQLEGVGRSSPVASGPCHSLPQEAPTAGSWVSAAEWVPDANTEVSDGPFVNASIVFQRLAERRARLTSAEAETKRAFPMMRILLVGDSITRYLMCFLAKSIAAELRLPGLEGCEPERSRGAHFQLWPPTAELRAKVPVVLHFISDFYFPESHVAQDLALMEREESDWMPSPDVIVVSRGTWDAWIRMPRASAGRHLLDGLGAGLWYMRQRYPHAEIVSYGLSHQYPARYHKHHERCAMQTSEKQVRSIVYSVARRVNAKIAAHRGSSTLPASASPIRYIDFYPMTRSDQNWASNTMNSDGMHYVGPHEPWFAKYLWRLLGVVTDASSDGAQAVLRSTPSAVDVAVCGDDQLALNTMPRQKKLRNPAKLKGTKAKRDCGLWLADRQTLLDFHKSFHRLQWKNLTRAIEFSDCVFYHKASAQRLGGIDGHWPSPFTQSMLQYGGKAGDGDGTIELPVSPTAHGSQREQVTRFQELARAVTPLVTSLWDRWKQNSVFCTKVERAVTSADMREMDMHIENGVVPCGHRLVYTLRSSLAKRRALGLPTLLSQKCDMVRKNRDL